MSEYCEDGSTVHMGSCFCHQSLSDIREFVNVLCYYNCKLCDHSCTSAADIRSHITDIHLHRTSATEVVEFASKLKSDACILTKDTHIMHPCSSELTPVSGAANEEAAVSETVGLASKEFLTISQSGCDFLSSTVIAHSADPLALQPLQSTIAGQTLQLLVNDEEVQLNVPSCFGGNGLQEIAAAGNMQHSLCVGSNSVQPVDPLPIQSGIAQTFESNEQITEMYVCDSCGTVFNGVGIVEHMLQVHGTSLDSVNVTGSQTVLNVSNEQSRPSACATRSVETAMPPNTMSIGTQAQLAKKPGRKRKVVADMTAAVVSEERRESLAQKENAAAVAVKTLGIERLTPTDGGSGLPKRRIQPPRALVEDYHIHRLRQSKPRTRSAVPTAPEIPCSFFGCNATFWQQETFDYHLKCHVDGESFCCPECHSSFVDWLSLLPHLWTVHNVNLYAYKCAQCQFHADQLSVINEHVIAEHGTNKPVQPFLCSICGQTFRKASLRKQHEKCHRNHSSFSWSRTRSDLTGFRRCVCDLCKRSFANKKSLNKHIEIVHKKIKPFSCSVCGYVAGRKAMLQLHERIHTGVKPFKCDMCNYSASDHNTLRRHRMRHTGQKPYRCAFCNYTAIQAFSLKMHMRTKHPTVVTSSAAAAAGTTLVYSCQSCPYQTVNHRSWLGHLQDHRTNPQSVTTGVDSVPAERLFVIERQDGGQLVLAPLVNVTQTTVSDPYPDIGQTSTVISSQSDSADQLGLRHILTAISEQQQSTSNG